MSLPVMTDLYLFAVIAIAAELSSSYYIYSWSTLLLCNQLPLCIDTLVFNKYHDFGQPY